MASIVYQNPGSSEVQSPLIAGLSEGLNKLSTILNLNTGELREFPLKAVAIDSETKNKIYEATPGYRLWLTEPTPVFKKNGTVIQPFSAGFSVDHLGGSVTFDKPLMDEDKVTVTATYVKADSETINQINALITALQQNVDRYKGFYENAQALKSAQPSAKKGDIAFVNAPEFAIFAWDASKGTWKNTQSVQDLSPYYTSEKVDELLGAKEPKVNAKGDTAEDENYFWNGKKQWSDVRTSVRNTKLNGLSASNSSDISATDSVIAAFGKLQAQLKKRSEKEYLTGTGEPTTSTIGVVGQRYANTSNGDWYTCTSASGGSYVWKKGINADGNKVLSTYDFSKDYKDKLDKLDSSLNGVKPLEATANVSGWIKETGGYKSAIIVPNSDAKTSIDILNTSELSKFMIDNKIASIYTENNSGSITVHIRTIDPDKVVSTGITLNLRLTELR